MRGEIRSAAAVSADAVISAVANADPQLSLTGVFSNRTLNASAVDRACMPAIHAAARSHCCTYVRA